MNYADMSEQQKERHKRLQRERYWTKKNGFFKTPRTPKPRMCGTVNKSVIDEDLKSKKENKKQQRERFVREDKEAKLLGISYGRYQILKMRGTLPPIPDHELPKPTKYLQEPQSKKRKAFNEFREEQMKLVAGTLATEKKERERIWNLGDQAAKRYKKITERQKEAEKRERS